MGEEACPPSTKVSGFYSIKDDFTKIFQRWFGERPGRKVGEPDTPDGEDAANVEDEMEEEVEEEEEEEEEEYSEEEYSEEEE